jgi:hypothetical protein
LTFILAKKKIMKIDSSYIPYARLARSKKNVLIGSTSKMIKKGQGNLLVQSKMTFYIMHKLKEKNCYFMYSPLLHLPIQQSNDQQQHLRHSNIIHLLLLFQFFRKKNIITDITIRDFLFSYSFSIVCK